MKEQIIKMVQDAIENGKAMEIRISIKGDENCITTKMTPEDFDVDGNVVTVYSGKNDYVCINTESSEYVEDMDEYFCKSNSSLVLLRFIS